jgi:DNA-directed RNA polymerase specialized sigma24 family protein
VTPNELRVEAAMVDSEEGTDCTTRACLLRGAADEIDRLTQRKHDDARLYVKMAYALVDAEDLVQEVVRAWDHGRAYSPAGQVTIWRHVPVSTEWYERAKGVVG